MNLNDVCKKALDNVLASGVIEKTLEEAITKTVSDTIKDLVRPFSEFGKTIKASIEKSLAFPAGSQLDLPTYNEQILQILRARMQAETAAAIEKQVAQQVAELMKPVPESMKLSELVAAYRDRIVEELKDENEYCESGDIFFIHETEHGFQRFGLHPKRPGSAYGKPPSRFDCDIQFGVYKSKLHNLKFNSKDVEAALFTGPFYDFERLLFQAKAAQTTIEIDLDQVDTYYSGSGD